jgi:hypothetical protein
MISTTEYTKIILERRGIWLCSHVADIFSRTVLLRLPKKRPPGNGDRANPPPAQRFPVQKEAVSFSVLSFISTVPSIHSRYRSRVVLRNFVELDPDPGQDPTLG